MQQRPLCNLSLGYSLTRKRIGTRRTLKFSSAKRADLMSGADGALVVDSGDVYINAGDIKRYSSITLDGYNLIVRGATSLGLATNDGKTPTIIGCQGNFTQTVNGGYILLQENGYASGNGMQGFTYSAPVVPFDSVVNPIQYTVIAGSGGDGGTSDTLAGYDNDNWGCGGGGGGGGATINIDAAEGGGWGVGGTGALSSQGGAGGDGADCLYDGFGVSGGVGANSSVATLFSAGGGGGAGSRGLNGGMLFLQIGATAAINGGTFIYALGGAGGSGGDGGTAFSPDYFCVGGGGGGGGSGGNGGNITIRYKSGYIDPSLVECWASEGGMGGYGGIGSGYEGYPGFDGLTGSYGTDGAIDIATY